jgi:hypothetical protein
MPTSAGPGEVGRITYEGRVACMNDCTTCTIVQVVWSLLHADEGSGNVRARVWNGCGYAAGSADEGRRGCAQE